MSGNNNSSSSCSSSNGGPCGACKFLRRKCVAGCIFAPYFDSEQGAAHFAAVHKVFGASNVSKLLLHIPENKRLDAVVTICYEAQARLRDPVYGCVAHILALQQQVANLRAELSYLQAHLAALELRTPPPLPLPLPLSQSQPQSMLMPSIYSFPTTLATRDLSSLFDRTITMLPSEIQPDGITSAPPEICPTSTGDGGDLQELAHELVYRRGLQPMSCTESSSLPPTLEKTKYDGYL